MFTLSSHLASYEENVAKWLADRLVEFSHNVMTENVEQLKFIRGNYLEYPERIKRWYQIELCSTVFKSFEAYGQVTSLRIWNERVNEAV